MDIAHQRALELVTEGKLEKAEPYFINALSRNPGDFSLIKDVAEATAAAISKIIAKQPHEACQELEWLVRFLSERIGYVSAEDLPNLLTLLEKHQQDLLNFDVEKVHEQGPTELRIDKEEILRTLKNNIPTEENEIHDALARLDLLEPCDESRDIEIQLRSALSAIPLFSELSTILSTVKGLKDPDEGSYHLTTAEFIVRELHKLLPFLSKQNAECVHEQRKRLEELSFTVTEQQRLLSSEKAWKAWKTDNDLELDKSRIWTAPFDLEVDKCQYHLEKLQRLFESLQAVIPTINCGPAAHEAGERLKELGEYLRKVSSQQHQQYNKWALEKIKMAYHQGCEKLGVVKDDKEEIGNNIVSILGPIDQRFLTTEVQRCYSEVFEYLFKALEPPKKNDKSFKQKNNKLNVLMRLANITKTSLSDF